MRKVLIIVGCLALLGVIAAPGIDFIQRFGGNRYPGTAQQAGWYYLQANAAQIRNALRIYAADHDGASPDSLADLVREKILTEASLHYPNIEDLPDRRDILKMHDFLAWIYLKPTESAPDLPMIIAPLPCKSSMGHAFPKPRRIIVTHDGSVSAVDEVQIEPVLHRIAQGHPANRIGE